jgi:hypothetical protein
MIEIFSHIPKVREFDAEERAEMGMAPRAPLCQRCNREATFANPVGVTLRRSWNPLDKNPRAGLDALCAECRERYRG